MPSMSAAGRSPETPTPPARSIPIRASIPSDSVPQLCRRINNALLRADQIWHQEGKNGKYWLAPLVADAEAGFGGTLNAFELMKGMIECGAAAVHFEDQLSSAKKCGHMGGKVLVPTQEAVHKLIAARLAADVCNVPTILIARTDANGAKLITSDIDPARPSLPHRRTPHRRRLLPHHQRPRHGHCARPRLRALRRHDLVRDQRTQSRRSAPLCRRHPCPLPRQVAGLQLLALVQLEEEA